MNTISLSAATAIAAIIAAPGFAQDVDGSASGDLSTRSGEVSAAVDADADVDADAGEEAAEAADAAGDVGEAAAARTARTARQAGEATAETAGDATQATADLADEAAEEGADAARAAGAATRNATAAKATAETAGDVVGAAAEGARDAAMTAAGLAVMAGEKVGEEVSDAATDAVLEVRSALDDGASTLVLADGKVAGEVDGIETLDDGRKMVEVDLNSGLQFGADEVMIAASEISRGDGQLNIDMTEGEFRAAVEGAASY